MSKRASGLKETKDTMKQVSMANTTMLVAMYLGLPRQGRQLKDKAKTIEQSAAAQAGTVRPPSSLYFRKKVWDPATKKNVELDALDTLKELQNEYKKRMRQFAKYPYAGDFYYAPCGVVDDLVKLKQQFEDVKLPEVMEQWQKEVYPAWKADAPDRMGNLYNENDYPTMHDCAIRFRMEMLIVPFAEKDQVAQVTLISPGSKDLLMKFADQKQKETIAQMHGQIWKDLMTPLRQVAEVFTKDKPRIYETLLGNLMQIVNVIPAYNDLLGDPELLKAAEQAKEVFSTMSKKDLKESEEQRQLALTTAQSMIATFEPFARKFVSDDDEEVASE